METTKSIAERIIQARAEEQIAKQEKNIRGQIDAQEKLITLIREQKVEWQKMIMAGDTSINVIEKSFGKLERALKLPFEEIRALAPLTAPEWTNEAPKRIVQLKDLILVLDKAMGKLNTGVEELKGGLDIKDRFAEIEAATGGGTILSNYVTEDDFKLLAKINDMLKGYGDSLKSAIQAERSLTAQIGMSSEQREIFVKKQSALNDLLIESAAIADAEGYSGVSRTERINKLVQSKQGQLDQLVREIKLRQQLENRYKEQTMQMEKVKSLSRSVASTFGRAVESMILDMDNWKGALQSLVNDLSTMLIRQTVTKPLVDMLTQLGVSAFAPTVPTSNVTSPVKWSTVGGVPVPSADGNAFNGGRVIPFANGGIIDSSTFFGLSGGNLGVMGEEGPEAVMPLKRGSDGKLGVEGGGNRINIQMTINTPDADSFRRSQSQITNRMIQSLRREQ